MRKIFLLLIFFPVFLSAQINAFYGGLRKGVYQEDPSVYKAWGYVTTNITSGNINDNKQEGYYGIRLLRSWSDLEPTNGGYDFTELLDDIDLIADSGLYIMLQINSGPDAPISWLYPLGIDTFYTSGGTIDGPYPDYYDPDYKARVLQFHDTLFKALNKLPGPTKSKLRCYFFGIGATGDTEPFKGDPVNSSFGIDDDVTWRIWYKNLYKDIFSYKVTNQITWLKEAFNASADGKEYEYFRSVYPYCWLKSGDPSHELSPRGSALIVQRFNRNNPVFGETQGPALTATTRYRYALARGARALHLTELTQPSGWRNNGAPKESTDFFTKHARDEFDFKRGFINTCDIASFDDVTRFSEGTYGNLISNTTGYNNRINEINASTESRIYKDWGILAAKETYSNATRIANITALYPGNAYIGWGLVPDFSINITQKAKYTTSQGVYQIGSSAGLYGELALEFIMGGGGTGAMYFDVDARLAYQAGDDLKIDIVYYDSGTAQWTVDVWNGTAQATALSVTNVNSNTFKTATVTVDNFNFSNQLTNASDIIINKINGANFAIEQIEVDNINK